jgi:hypothetical protein
MPFMNLRRALTAACFLPLCSATAVAQFGPPPAQQQEPKCVQEFVKLRGEVEKRGEAIKAANERKASAHEACSLFNAFLTAQNKMLKYAVDNGVWCGIPPNITTDIKTAITKVSEIRTRVCQAAAAPARPQGPSLSDALSNPVPNSNNIKTGRGTFDTLTGSPLGK